MSVRSKINKPQSLLSLLHLNCCIPFVCITGRMFDQGDDVNPSVPFGQRPPVIFIFFVMCDLVDLLLYFFFLKCSAATKNCISNNSVSLQNPREIVREEYTNKFSIPTTFNSAEDFISGVQVSANPTPYKFKFFSMYDITLFNGKV